MLLKVSDGVGGWVLIDNVDQAHLLPANHSVKNATELTTLGGLEALILISKDCFKGDPVAVGIIEFTRNTSVRRLIFTNIVYVCNDKGDTLDRLSVERKNERRR